jgi:carbonic anhydrase/acetyltransferase-like protein (isoleucine patch superfamily)
MDHVQIGDECIVGALSFIKAGEKIPWRSLVAGNPARILREVSDEMLRWKTEGTALYQALPAQMRESWKECEAEKPAEGAGPNDSKKTDAGVYRPWKDTQ